MANSHLKVTQKAIFSLGMSKGQLSLLMVEQKVIFEFGEGVGDRIISTNDTQSEIVFLEDRSKG